jgi:hypothetical protein
MRLFLIATINRKQKQKQQQQQPRGGFRVEKLLFKRDRYHTYNLPEEHGQTTTVESTKNKLQKTKYPEFNFNLLFH